MIAFHVFPILVLLFYFATWLHFTSRHDNCQTAVVVFGTKNHAFADDTFQFARSKVGDEANLFAYQFFRLIMFAIPDTMVRVSSPSSILNWSNLSAFGTF